MFTVDFRETLRSEILRIAAQDPRITGGAITGSAVIGKLDEWSDIDLAFGVEGDLFPVLNDFSKMMFGRFSAVDSLDVLSAGWIYRVFLLQNSLQVDIAVAPQEIFCARASTFQLQFGSSRESQFGLPQTLEILIGHIWLNALHIRSSLKRDRLWQADHFLNSMRNYVIQLMCRRFGLAERDGRGVDQLPRTQLDKLLTTRPIELSSIQLSFAFKELSYLYLEELDISNSELGVRLRPVLNLLLDSK